MSKLKCECVWCRVRREEFALRPGVGLHEPGPMCRTRYLVWALVPVVLALSAAAVIVMIALRYVGVTS